MAKLIGVDLGTSNTFIFSKMQGIIMKKPSVIAVDRKSREIISLGMDAKKMLGKTPEGIPALISAVPVAPSRIIGRGKGNLG